MLWRGWGIEGENGHLQCCRKREKKRVSGRLHLLWSELLWKRDTELRHQSSHGQTQTQRIETETHQMCPHSEQVTLEPPWLFVWFIQQFFFRGLLRNQPLPSLLLITLLSTLDNPINYYHTNEYSWRTHTYTCIHTHCSENSETSSSPVLKVWHSIFCVLFSYNVT